MSLQADLAALDARFRKRQTTLQAGVGILVQRRFEQLPVEDIMASGIAPSVEDWLRRSVSATTTLNARSATEGRDFYDSVRDFLAPGAPMTHPKVDPPDAEAIRTSLITTGLVRARKSIGDAPKEYRAPFLDPESPESKLLSRGREAAIEDAVSDAADWAGAAAGRHVANGGREQVLASAAADSRAKGYVRITSSKPCFFCAALASRGAVYDDDSFDDADARFIGPGQVKVHDHCSCALRPVFTRSVNEVPELSRSFQIRWDELKKDSDGNDRAVTMLLWRQSYEGRLRSR